MRRSTHFHIDGGRGGSHLEVYSDGELIWIQDNGDDIFSMDADASLQLSDALKFVAQELREGDA